MKKENSEEKVVSPVSIRDKTKVSSRRRRGFDDREAAKPACKLPNISEDQLRVNGAKAALVNEIQTWVDEGDFKTIKAAAEHLGEGREVLSRIMSGKVLHMSLEKLFRLAVKAGIDVRFDSSAKLRLADNMSAWMEKLLDLSIAKLHHPQERSQYSCQGDMMMKLIERLEAYDSPTPSQRSLKMICTGKRWELDLCSQFYRDIAELGEEKGLRMARILVSSRNWIEHNRALARLSAATSVATFLLDVDDTVPAEYLPPKNVGFWILGHSRVIIHTSVHDEGIFLVEEVDDAALAAYLDRGVFERARAVSESVPMPSDPEVSHMVS